MLVVGKVAVVVGMVVVVVACFVAQGVPRVSHLVLLSAEPLRSRDRRFALPGLCRALVDQVQILPFDQILSSRYFL